jgi:hypothetical protein
MKEETDRDWWNKQTDDYKMDFMRMRNTDYPEYNYLSTTEFIAQFEVIWREDKKKNQSWPVKKNPNWRYY